MELVQAPQFISSELSSKKFRYALEPLKKAEPQILNFGTFDIEGRDWVHLLVCGAYDGNEYKNFRNVGEFLEWAFSRKVRTYFCHFGGIYDFLFILQWCLENDGYEVDDFIPRGSGLLSFVVKKGNDKITFRDSGALLPMSLERITKSFGVSTPKQNFDVSNLKKITPKLLKYLKADCIGLHESLTKFYESPLISKAGSRSTTASQSLQVYRTFLKRKIPSLRAANDNYIREAYAGGRTEIFRPIYSGEKNSLHYYDVNSLYPFVMREFSYPFQLKRLTRELDLRSEGFADVTIYSDEGNYLPILWKKTPKFIFQNGIFRGRFPMNELRYAVENGVEILEVHSVMEFQKGEFIFKEFIDSLYKIRMQAKDEFQNMIAKLMMNSLYGRMGLNLYREGLQLDHGQENVKPHFSIHTKRGEFRFMKFPTEISSFTNVAIAAYVTAYARIHMHKLITPIQDDIFYMDTDSIVTTRVLPSSKELGALKHEKSTDKACFLLPKTYIFGSDVTMKGFKNRKVQHFTYDDFESYFYGESKIQIKNEKSMHRMKGAMKRGSFLQMKSEEIRELKAKYDKRVIVNCGKYLWDSKPLEVFE